MELITTQKNKIINFGGNSLVAASTYQDAFISFLDYFKNHKKKKETTILAYTKNLRTFGAWLNANSITTPTAKDLDNYISFLEAQCLKPTTIQAYLNTLKQFYKWLSFEYGVKDEAQGLQATNKNDATEFKKDYLRPNQIRDLLAQFNLNKTKDLRNYTIIALMVCTGLRTIELERANIEDLKEGDSGEYKLYIQGKGKGDKKKYVKLPHEVITPLLKYLGTRGSLEPTSPLFTSLSNNDSRGSRLEKGAISKMVKKSLRAIGLDRDTLTAHSLRHTTATLNLLNGGTLEETRQLLRHTNVNTTLIYVHALEREKNNSEQRIASSIFTTEYQKEKI